MAKLFLSITFICCCVLQLFAQEYTVFDIKGTPTLLTQTKEILLQKGYPLSNDRISLKKNDTLTILDNQGLLYRIDKVNTYQISDIKKFKSKSKNETLSKKYFKYVWGKINKKEGVKNHTANVYRSDKINMLITPKDTTYLYSNQILFQWKKDSINKHTYFFIKNNSNKTLSKLKVEGNSLTLYVDGLIIKSGENYSWAIASTKFPNFNSIKFNYFEVLSKTNYLEKKSNYSAFIDELKNLNFKEKEIKTMLCSYYNICN